MSLVSDGVPGRINGAKRQLMLNIDQDVAQRVHEIAIEEERTVSDTLRRLLWKGIAAHDAQR